MSFRVADTTSSSNLISRINVQRGRVGQLQEQIASGKRINRPSDDPSGAEIVLNLRTSQAEIVGFQRAARSADQKLTAADDALNGYQGLLDRLRALTTQGLSDSTSPQGKNSIATEMESLRSQVLAIANRKNGDEFIFGGTRQNAPPYDPSTGAPAATPSSGQFVQIEPGAVPIAVGVTAESVFADATSSVFNDINSAIAALRGTGNPTADTAALRAFSSRLVVYTDLSSVGRSVVGGGMKVAEMAGDNLTNTFDALDDHAGSIEGVDFTAAAVGLADAQRLLDASLQVAAQGRRSLFDYLS